MNATSEAKPEPGRSTPVHVRTAAVPGEPLLRDRRPDACAAVLFGITGDLARRKLVPGLYNLALAGSLPESFAVVGVSRSVGSEDELRRSLRAALDEHSRTRPVDEAVWERFARRLFAVRGGVDDADTYAGLQARLEELDASHGTRGNRLVYFATPPSAFPRILPRLHETGLVRHAREGAGEAWQRVVLEKPFGRDLDSARALNRLALELLDESQLYRIDHYLGKETVQNLLVLRFGNTIFEPLWNRNHIDHVQITMAESIGVGERGRFYEETGVLRDIVQNHLLQVLALCTMEPPVSFDADEIRNMKSQALRALRPLGGTALAERVVRGQYEGYRGEAGVAPDSATPTYVALEAHVDNWRWQGVPFYLRAGKALARRVTEVSFHFRSIPFCLFGDERTCQLIPENVLKVRIQPDEGVALRVSSKIPGEELRVGGVSLDFLYSEAFDCQPAEAYERLLVDCMRGDATLFARRDEVEHSWSFVTPVLEAWEHAGADGLERYARGSEGPDAARRLLARGGRRWEHLAR